MDEKTQKERLEQELRFLKESFEAEVISKEEFVKGKERIELKLKEINHEVKASPIEEIDEKKVEKPEIAAQKPKEEKKDIKAEMLENEKSAEQNQGSESARGSGESRFFKYAAIFIILILLVFFSYSVFREKKEPVTAQASFTAECSSAEDCKQEGMEGICLSPASKDAKCEYKAIQKINVLIVNDRKNCFNCDTKRVIGILQEWFGPTNVKEIDYTTNEGRKLAEQFGSTLLPIYILDENITKKPAFEKYSQVFIHKNGSYILSDDASGSTLYFRRQNVLDRLDLFLQPGDAKSIQAEKNLQEFLDAFKEVKFEKHVSDELTGELGIKVFPSFLINNRIKFTNAQPADVIKENFCRLNTLQDCNITLSKNLV